MKALLLVLIVLLCPTLASADQALVLSEIEQIQEKIWYLQRDVATQKTTLEQQQQQITAARASLDKTDSVEQRLDALTELLNSQNEKNRQIDNNLRSLKDTLAALVNEFNQQNTAQLQQAEKSGTQEGLLQALRDDVAANRARTEQLLADTEKKLAETRTRLEAMQQQQGDTGNFGLYLGGLALLLTILLAVAVILLHNRTNHKKQKRESHPHHEL